jgi:hypothetical protein
LRIQDRLKRLLLNLKDTGVGQVSPPEVRTTPRREQCDDQQSGDHQNAKHWQGRHERQIVGWHFTGLVIAVAAYMEKCE